MKSRDGVAAVKVIKLAVNRGWSHKGAREIGKRIRGTNHIKWEVERGERRVRPRRPNLRTKRCDSTTGPADFCLDHGFRSGSVAFAGPVARRAPAWLLSFKLIRASSL